MFRSGNRFYRGDASAHGSDAKTHVFAVNLPCFRHNTNPETRMRRQDIQLLAHARQGNVAARCEAGRRYLLGIDGFPRHIATGIDYLTHPSVRDLPQAAQIIVEALPLQDILALHHEPTLRIAASAGIRAAQAKLGAWLCMRRPHAADGLRWLEQAAASGHEGAKEAGVAIHRQSPAVRREVLEALANSGDLDALCVAVLAVREALTDPDFNLLGRDRNAARTPP